MKIMKIFCFVIACLLVRDKADAQIKNKKIDSLIIIEYYQTSNLPNFSSTSVRNLYIVGNTSYYFISNPLYEVDDQSTRTASVIKYKDSNYLLVNGPMMPKYDRFTYWKDSLTPMKWYHTGKKESFDGRMGYEARTYFRGRIFTAFYDPLIPISDGPFKFNGLPGLIIKLYDSDKIWDFRLKSIAKVPNNFKVSKIQIAGDFELFKSTYLVYRKKSIARDYARQNVDPNCVGCANNIPKTYSMEKDIEFNTP